MAMYVHLTAEADVPLIRRNGIRPARMRMGDQKVAGIFAMPVTPDYAATYQWVRELRRFKAGRIWGVYFRISDDEQVYMGPYGSLPEPMTAAQAAAHVAQSEKRGLQVMIPRKITAREILRTKLLPQLIGWRYYPDAKGRKPCGCPVCQRGDYGARKIRDAYEHDLVN